MQCVTLSSNIRSIVVIL